MRNKSLALASAACVGVLMALLVKLGNPGNMGICGVCFIRDVAGALRLHSASAVQYLRPEVFGVILGASLSAIMFKEFKSRGGSSPFARFLLGILISAGALVFLGCPIRMVLRIAGGDANALVGAVGLFTGIGAAVFIQRSGFGLGRAALQPKLNAYLLPLLSLALLGILAFKPNVLGQSAEGLGAKHALWYVSLCIALAAGFLLQRIRFCTISGFREGFFNHRDPWMTWLLLALIGGCMAANIAFGQFKFGFADQPVAHTNHVWNFAGMVLTGLACSLAGGCPLRHLVLGGEGNSDSIIVILGMLCGAALAHNFQWVSSPKGISPAAPWVLALGVIICLIIGFGMRDKGSATDAKS